MAGMTSIRAVDYVILPCRDIDASTDQDFGHRTLFFRDPEANIVEIFAEI